MVRPLIDLMHTIAIIGAGFSGSLVAAHLLRVGARVPFRVVLIDRAGAFGPGLAYGHGSEGVLLNVVAGRMSALPDEPGDFLQWARRQDPSVRGEMFLPRRLYGRYIADLLERAARECGPGRELVRIADEVVDVRADADSMAVVCGARGEIRADQVVLASGNAAPARPSWSDVALEASGRFVADPWRGAALSGIRVDERVVVVGSGLTMMDVALSLDAAGHRGTIDVVSRRGLLPQHHRHGNPDLAKLPDPLFSRTFSNVRELFKAVRAAAEQAESMGGDWRDAVNALRPITPTLWEALDERERRRFMEHLLPFWNTHRHRAPPSVAEGIESLKQSGRLRVHAARIKGVKVRAGGVAVEIQPRGADWASGKVELAADRIINCTGPDADVRRSGDPLTSRLLASGMVRPGPLGMGLDFDDEGRVVPGDGRGDPRVYLVGPARMGRHWEATAVPELRVQAAAVARRLIAGLRLRVETCGGAGADGRATPESEPRLFGV